MMSLTPIKYRVLDVIIINTALFATYQKIKKRTYLRLKLAKYPYWPIELDIGSLPSEGVTGLLARLAEGVGFEPTEDLRPLRFSRPVQ